MRKSLVPVALLASVLTACTQLDDQIPTKAGPFGLDLSGTWQLQSVDGVLPFVTSITVSTPAPCTTASRCRAEILSGTMIMEYDVEKSYEMRTSHRLVHIATGAEVPILTPDSTKRGKYYTTTGGDGSNIVLQVDMPQNGIFAGGGSVPNGGTVTENNTVITTGGFKTATLTVSTQTWVWRKQ